VLFAATCILTALPGTSLQKTASFDL
jgi:hypothetical protein